MTTEVMKDAANRMDRARAILTDNNPRPDCNWGMLDTTALRQAIEQASIDTSQSHACTWPACNPEAEKREPVAWRVRRAVDGRYMLFVIQETANVEAASQMYREPVEPLFTAPHTQAKEIEGLRAAAQSVVRLALDNVDVHPCDYGNDEVASRGLPTEMRNLYIVLNAAIAQQTKETP